MAWTMLIIAGVLESAWALMMPRTVGWTKLWPSVWTLVLMAASFYLLSLAMKTLPTGTAYAAWTGIGTVGVVAFGVATGKEPATVARLVFIVMIIGGIVGLKLIAAPDPRP